MNHFSTFFNEYFVKKIPCSFTYDGKPAEFGELQEVGGDNKRKCYARVMEDDRFKAVLHIDVLHDSSAIEWWLDVSAPGEYDSDVIDNLSYCDLGIEMPFICEKTKSRYAALHWAKGSRASETDFQPQVENLWPLMRDKFEFKCDNGRTSSGCMPYFNLQMSETTGCILAIGWTGQWYMTMQRKDTDDHVISTIEFKVRMDRSRFRVYSGETFSLPRMMIMPWEGMNLEESYNSFRRMITKDLPLVDGEKLVPPTCIYTWGGLSAEYHKKAIEMIKKNGLNKDLYYWVDAGWFGAGYEKSNADYMDTWYENVGEWTELPALYPNGLKEVGDAVKEAGMKFILWFEFERTVSRHDIVKKHREYFLGPKLPYNTVDFHEGARTRYSLMLNLGNDDARRYITEVMANHIEKTNMHGLRIDFNYEPLEYWRYGDSEDRWGVTELKYINGFYALIDELRERFPRLLIDNCASGGRRLDYRMQRRSMPLSFTDYVCTADRKMEAMQLQNYTGAKWLPVHGGVSASSKTDYEFRSHMANSSSLWIDNKNFEYFEKNNEWYAKMFEQARRARPLFEKDLYLLTGLSTELNTWFAYEAYDDEAKEGLILAFRREECADDSLKVFLKGLDLNGEYVFEDVDRGSRTISGEDIAAGYTISIPEVKSSALIFFKKVK